MVSFTTTIHKFGSQGEKSGWTYIEVPADIAEKLKPGNKKSFRVKGRLDKYKFSGTALLPMGNGTFILPFNAVIRKGTGKGHGAMVAVQMEEDKAGFQFNKDFVACLADDPDASAFFKTLTGSHQRYFSKWIDDARTEQTRANRIARALNALARKWGYPEMLRNSRKE
ncbi:MAG TPA: YdeI/OmpD-associated family protein [Chitinophagaceae bacterium]